MNIRRIEPADRAEVNAFIVRQWFTRQMIVRGETVDLGETKGFYVREDGEIIGLITYRVIDRAMEILSLDSLREGCGVGGALLETAVSEAKALGCPRVFLITTNDNLNALRFYQKRGFDMTALYRNALDVSRRMKPEIPETGFFGIPLRHEIELERLL